MDLVIQCPKCRHEFQLAGGVLARLHEQIRGEVLVETQELAREEFKKESANLTAQVEEQEKHLEEANARELELRRKQRELEKKVKEVDLEVERRLSDELKLVESDARDRLAKEHALKDSEKDERIKMLTEQIGELKRRAEQGSEQAQGEAGETQLESVLRAAFPWDDFQAVGKGVRGADLIQGVVSPAREKCGTIIWESKNTKHWNQEWLTKLRDDQMDAKADIAALVSVRLPSGIGGVAYVNDVWVADFQCAVGLATALRATLIEVTRARLASTDKGSKMEMLYKYLSGSEFRQRVTAMADAVAAMRKDLAAEKQVFGQQWAKREKQMNRLVDSVLGIRGDVAGITDTALPDVPQLGLPEEEPQLPESHGNGTDDSGVT